MSDIDRRALALGLAVRGVLGLAWIAITLFGLAGRVDWPAAWIMTGMFAVYLTAGAMWFVQRNPELLTERMALGKSALHWDRRLMNAYRVLLPALFVTAALDAGRFGWSVVPFGAQVLGAAGMVGAFTVIWWCTSANNFLSSQVRLQTERGHTVVQNGPYRHVRHPMYASLIVLMTGMALLLGSWLALVPAVLIAAIFVVRTVMEDRLLTEQLAGYRAYTARVPARLVPGVW